MAEALPLTVYVWLTVD